MGIYMSQSERQMILREFGLHYGYKLFFETGTADGDTSAAMADSFDHVITVELDETRYYTCAKRFMFDPKVTLIYGDSGDVIERFMGELNQPTLFWLDAHRMGGEKVRLPRETPIEKELYHILSEAQARNLDHAVFIDDARLFGTVDGYPHPAWVREQAERYGYEFESKRDLFHLRRKK